MLTPSQREALHRNSHTAIVANAGSGKTKVLVEQYLDVLLKNERLSPRQIVTITFSEQAAKDIKKKIRGEIIFRLEKETDTKIICRLHDIHDDLPGAIISTIHSFCGQLLRQYPTEAKVDSTFSMLTKPEDLILREECIDNTLYDVLERSYSGGSSPELQRMIKRYGRGRVSRFLSFLFSKRFTALQLSTRLNSLSDKPILEEWNRLIESDLEDYLLPLFDIRYYTDLLNSILSDKKRPDTEKTIQEWHDAATLKEKLLAVSSILTLFHNKSWDSLNGKLIAKEAKENLLGYLPSSLSEFRTYQEIIDSYCSGTINAEIAEIYIRDLRILLDLFKQANERYQEQKSYYSLLDFDDLLYKAYTLLERPDVRIELINRYPFLLVDEFQDTDNLQYSIIKSLTSDFIAANRLIIVGDPKQSIYGFRNANVSLFNKTIQEIFHATREDKIELKESFRMLSYPLAFINILFSALFSNGTKKSEIEYSELVLGRNDNAQGSVEFLINRGSRANEVEEANDPPSENDNIVESELIAKKIAEICALNSQYSISEFRGLETISRPISYRDIGILLRSRTHLEKIETALRKAQIPFLTYGGRGFYTSPEIIDIINYLTFLTNPADDIALAATLRSPYFSISDPELFSFCILKSSIPYSLWQKMTLKLQGALGSTSRIKEVCRTLIENIDLAGKLTSSRLLEKIFSETLIFGILETQPDGDQRIANLRKFADLSLSFSSSGFLGTFDFMERINLLAQREEEEALAEPLSDNNAVHIMTIHASKGLEFPAVFLPFLGRDISKGDSRRNTINIDEQIGISIKDPESDAVPTIAKLIDIHTKKKGLEEEKRILYVAVTRARDHLFLSATIGGVPKEGSYIGWMSKIFETDFSASFTISRQIKVYSPQSGQSSKKTISFEVPVISEIKRDIVLDSISFSKRSQTAAIIQTAEINPSEGHTRYSPTQLLVYRQCPTKYHLRFNLGIPEDVRLSFDFPPPDGAEYLKGTLVGHLVHKVLESVDQICEGGPFNELIFTEYLRHALEELGLEATTDLLKYQDKIRSHLRTFAESSFGRSVLSSNTYLKELPLRIDLNERQMLSGVIDRLYKDGNGAWHILDYKTDRGIDDPEKIEKYKFQLRFYAYLVSRLFDTNESIYGHLFFTNFSVVENFEFSKHDLIAVASELNFFVTSILKDKISESLSLIERNRSHCPECAYYDAQKSKCLADQ